jgi:ech hydrogenase subunit D
MSKSDPQVFKTTSVDTILGTARQYKEDGWRFVNICGSATMDGILLLYSVGKMEELENLTMLRQIDDHVPSISNLFENAFFFENETQDLYGIHFDGLNLDYHGQWYGPAEAHPMAHNIQVIERKQKAAAEATKEAKAPVADAKAEKSSQPVAKPATKATKEANNG